VLTTKNGRTEDTARAIMVKEGLNLFLFGSEYLPNHTSHTNSLLDTFISLFSTKSTILTDVEKHILTIHLGSKNIPEQLQNIQMPRYNQARNLETKLMMHLASDSRKVGSWQWMIDQHI